MIDHPLIEREHRAVECEPQLRDSRSLRRETLPQFVAAEQADRTP